MELFTLMHAKVLYLRFCAIYDHKFVKPYHDEDFKSLWANEWSHGLSQINTKVIKDALDYCRKNLDWPPSIAEFIKICESCLGVPTIQECIKLALNRDFNHPIVLICYENVGSWSMKNDTEKQLFIKFQSVYQDALNKFRDSADSTWKQLESYNERPKELPAPSKIPSTSESKAFRENMNKCQELLKGKKIIGGGRTYREFETNKIKKGHREFDQSEFNEYKIYLMSIHETETMILPPEYLFDRNKFLNMNDQPEWLKNQGYIPENERDLSTSSGRTSKGKPEKVYKSWTND